MLHQFISTVKKFQNKVKDTIEKILTGFSITVTYFLGIGLSSIVGRLFQTRFLTKKYQSSSWVTQEEKNLNVEKMY